MKSGRNLVEMSEAVEHVLDRLRTNLLPPDIALTRVNDLPRQVQTRIGDFRSGPSDLIGHPSYAS